MTFGYLEFIRRASPTAPTHAALGARSAVWARFRPGEVEDRSLRPWVKVIWSLAGEGTVRLSGRTHRLPAGHVAVFFPGMRHEAWASHDAGAAWEARWVTMDGPLCGAFAQAVGLQRAGLHRAHVDLHPVFERYRDGLAAATPAGARTAELAAHELLASLGGGAATQHQSQHPVTAEALSLLRAHWAEADFGIAELAGRIGVHRSVLSRRFQAAVGVSPLDHLLDLRMSHALTLLRVTDLSIKEVAAQCGFADPGYFARLFRRRQGLAPVRYRAEAAG